MNIYEAFETDAKAVEEGRWLQIEFQGKEVCSVRVRSASPELNPELRKSMTDMALGMVEKNKGSALDLTVNEALRDPTLERELFANAVVSGWKGVTDKAGKPLKCTPKNVAKVFEDLPLLFQQVKRAAYRWETFRSTVVEASLGN